MLRITDFLKRFLYENHTVILIIFAWKRLKRRSIFGSFSRFWPPAIPFVESLGFPAWYDNLRSKQKPRMKVLLLSISVCCLSFAACGNHTDHASDSTPPAGQTVKDTTVPQIMPGTPGGDTGTAPRPKDTAYLHHPDAKRAADTTTHLPNKD